MTAPSQFPVPSGLTPASWPNWGVKASICEKESDVAGVPGGKEVELEVDAGGAAVATAAVLVAGGSGGAAECEQAFVAVTTSVLDATGAGAAGEADEGWPGITGGGGGGNPFCNALSWAL